MIKISGFKTSQHKLRKILSFRRVIAMLLALMALFGANGFTLPKSSASPPYRIGWSEVVSQMHSFASNGDNRLERAVIAYEMPDNSTSQVSVIGNNNAYPQWSADTIFEVGSMAKVFVAAAVLKLIEEKPEVFGYNVPAAMDRLVYTLSNMGDLQLEPHGAYKQNINIRHLLTHTSGMRYIEPFASYNVYPAPDGNYWNCRNSGDSISNWVGSPGLTNECIYDWDTATWRAARRTGLWKVSRHAMRQRLLETTDIITGATYVTAPGTRLSYSNWDYILLARLIESYTGISFNRYIRDKIFAPLNMNNSFFVLTYTDTNPAITEGKEGSSFEGRLANVKLITDSGQPSEVAAPLQANGDYVWDERRKGWTFAWPEGGMYSTAGDLLKFLRMIRKGGYADGYSTTTNGARVLSSDSINLLIRDQLDYLPNLRSEDRVQGRTAAFGYIKNQVVAQGDNPLPLNLNLSAGSLWAEGRFMTYFFMDKGSSMNMEQGISGIFLSQRLTNVANPVDNSRKIGEQAMGKFSSLVVQMR